MAALLLGRAARKLEHDGEEALGHALVGRKERYCRCRDCRYYAHAKAKLAANRFVGRLRRKRG